MGESNRRNYHDTEQARAGGYFKEKQNIVRQKTMNMAGKVLFVARGTVIEKDGVHDDIIYELKHKRGNIACL